MPKGFDILGKPGTRRLISLSLVGLLSFAFYLLFLANWVGGGDAGELAGAVLEPGVPHPPGFPLYLILAHGFSLLVFWLEPAVRVSLFSAFCGSASLVISWQILRELKIEIWIRVLIILGLLLHPVLLSYHSSVEVFALNHLLLTAFLWLWRRIMMEESSSIVRSSFLLLSGLGISHHHIFIIPLAVAWISLWRRPSARLLYQGRDWAFLLLGLSPYFILPLIAKTEPYFDWGQVDGWSGFWWHFFRRDFGTFKLSMGSMENLSVFANLQFFVGSLWRYWPIGLLAILAAPWAWSNLGIWVKWTIAAALCNWLVFVGLGNLDLQSPIHRILLERFSLQSIFLLAPFVACSLQILAEQAESKWVRVAMGIAVAFSLFGPLSSAVQAYRVGDEGLHFKKLADEILSELPPQAILLVEGDHLTNTLRFRHRIEGVRSDIRVVDMQMLTQGWYLEVLRKYYPDLKLPDSNSQSFRLEEFLRMNSSWPLFVANGFRPYSASIRQNFEPWPEGLIERLWPAGQGPDLLQWRLDSETLLHRASYLRKIPSIETRWDQLVSDHYWQAKLKFSLKLYDLAGSLPADRLELIQLCVEQLREIHRDSLDPLPIADKFLGLALESLAVSLANEPAVQADLIKERDQALRRYLQSPMSEQDPLRSRLEQAINPSVQ